MKSKNCDAPGGFRSNTRAAFFLSVLFTGLFLLLPPGSSACGPDFPNNLLGSGDAPLLAAPIADFRRELAMLELTPGPFDYLPPANYDFAAQALETEVADLTSALRKAGIPDREALQTVLAYQKQRTQFNAYVRAAELWNAHHNAKNSDIYLAADMPTNAPVLPEFAAIPGLPNEFADYFTGAVAWRAIPPATNTARQAWQRLLERPAAERKFKSTWAAYMLGTSWANEDADKAVAYFRQTRELAQRGYADSTGLAVASLGREARVELARHNYPAALTLYLDQYAAGDVSAVTSLRSAAARTVKDPNAPLAELAKAPRLRVVITAYLISDGARRNSADDDTPTPAPVAAWLAAVEAAGVADVEAAERLALAAYQSGNYELAEGWVKRARHSVVAQWVQAKLLLRKGQVPAAAAVLSRLAQQLPPDPESNRPELLDRLTLAQHQGRAHLHGEWGVLTLIRGDYTEALDTLLRAGFWEDAAYVAERVLTTDELKSYVDQNWPAPTETNAVSGRAVEETAASPGVGPNHPDIRPDQIRHLLARRLTREARGREAQAYYPPAWRESLRALLTALDGATDATADAPTRARQFFIAARITRTNGLELLGTELAPDWFLHAGQFDFGLTWQDRATNNLEARINIASEAELDRAARHGTDPDERFHYRYQAASLGWEAAKLLPDNNDETARILCTAGTWLKSCDPDTADLFYKALVRRCRQTAIGAQADVMRWFPVLDENGDPIPHLRSQKLNVPKEPTLMTEHASDSQPATEPDNDTGATTGYIVKAGDTLARIASTFSTAEHSISMKEILEANPGLWSDRLRVGLRILIPAAKTTASTEATDLPR